MIFKFQKQVHEELKQLRLLPIQQTEKQRLTISEKLRQRYKDFLKL